MPLLNQGNKKGGNSGYNCHSGTVDLPEIKVSEDKTLIISGGGHSRQVDFSGTDLIFDLAKSVANTAGCVRGNQAAMSNKLLSKLLVQRPAIEIDWPDYGIPKLDKAFWDKLADTLRKFASQSSSKSTRVTFCCIGGHGRTGSALSIIAYKLGLVPDGKSPVAWVRDNYCHNAVESNSQVKYIGEICGISIDDKERGYSKTTPAATTPYVPVPNEILAGKNQGLWFFRGKFYESKSDAQKDIKSVPSRYDTLPVGSSGLSTCASNGPHYVQQGSPKEIEAKLRQRGWAAHYDQNWGGKYWEHCMCPRCMAWREHLADVEGKKQRRSEHIIKYASNKRIRELLKATDYSDTYDEKWGDEYVVGCTCVRCLAWAQKNEKFEDSRPHEIILGSPSAIDTMLKMKDYSEHLNPSWGNQYNAYCICDRCLAWAQHITGTAETDTKKEETEESPFESSSNNTESAGNPASHVVGRQVSPTKEIKATAFTPKTDKAATISAINSRANGADLNKRASKKEVASSSLVAGMITRRIES